MVSKDYKLYDTFNTVIFNEVRQALPRGGKILDVGCWTGNLGKQLVKYNCEMHGIDLEAGALKIALENGYKTTAVVDLNAGETRQLAPDSNYDLMIFADVLEHTIDPAKILQLARENLKPNGKIIVSVPNIAFAYYRLTLLFGQWNYQDKGTLDRTHLKFYTYKTIRQLISDNGYNQIKYYGTSTVQPKYAFLRVLARIWPSLFAIQTVVVAQKN